MWYISFFNDIGVIMIMYSLLNLDFSVIIALKTLPAVFQNPYLISTWYYFQRDIHQRGTPNIC